MIARHLGECRSHEYQDKRYGKGYRVMNPVTVKGKLVGWRCSVCCPPKEKGKRRGGVFDVTEILPR